MSTTTAINPVFGILPSGVLGNPVPFNISIPQPDLDQLTALVQHGVIAAPTYYNTHNISQGFEYAFGASRDWLADAQGYWTSQFDWRAHEARWNTIPQFTISLPSSSPENQNQTFNLHFAALFSSNKDATPVIFSHGWPSSWMDFIPIMQLLADKYTPETLPYHIIAPSIPDFGLSTRSDVTETELDFYKAAGALNELMKALGFGISEDADGKKKGGYIAQGGDVGSGLTSALGGGFEDCRAVHFNNFLLTPSEKAGVASLPLTETEAASNAVAQAFVYGGTGYMLEQGTKPGAISLVVESNPLAMLSWIGSMYAEGASTPIDHILQQVSWYWLTKSYGSGLWAYRGVWEPMLRDANVHKLPSPLKITKPIAYSYFPQEVLAAAESWVNHWFPDNLVFFRKHEKGGHFASVDDPVGLLQDVEDFVALVKEKLDW